MGTIHSYLQVPQIASNNPVEEFYLLEEESCGNIPQNNKSNSIKHLHAHIKNELLINNNNKYKKIEK